VCGITEDMKHIYICEILNEGDKQSEQYENIFNGNITQQIKVFRKFELNMKKREVIKNNKFDKMETKPPCDPLFDPLFCID
jgi:hypothetical protein